MNKKIKKMEDVVTIPMTKYVTTDGKEFTDDYDANMHQAHLDSMAEAKLCFEKYGIYTSDLMIKNHKNNDQIISNDYLLTRVLHTDISSNDDLYILQAKDEEAEKEILKTFRDYLNTDVMDRRFLNAANNYIFPHTIIFCRDSIYGNYNALCAEREFELIEKALKFGRQVLNMADKKEDNIVSDEAKEKNMINKRELAARLKQGECLEEIFDFTDGQECLIYKGEFEVSDKIIYIPDIYLNKLNLGVVATGENLIDPVYLVSQTINESAYGTSALSKKAITKVITGDSVKKDANGNVTGFQKVNGKYITKTIPETTVYNLYGIKAYDSDPQLCGSSYAYYMGWTSVDKALNGAAQYVADNYIHNTVYQQNTLFKMRYNPKKDNIWHQYSTNPSYAEEIAEHMKNMKSVYDGCSNIFTYDRPAFVKEPETTTTTAKPTTTTAKPTTTTTATKPTTTKYTVTGTLPNARVKASKSNYDLRIKLPSGVTSYYLEDKYTSRQLFMSCAGNYVSHFNNASNRYAKSSMSGFTVKYNSTKKRTYVYVKASSSYRGYAVSFDNGYAYIKWGTPKTMYKNILVLDAGHGGSDSGATGNRLREKDLTLSIVLAAKKQFDKDKNYAVYYTRTTDTYPSLTDRSDLANNVGADYFLSCHINSAGATAKGSETLYNSQGYKASNGVTSYKWAANVHNFTKAATGFTNRGLVDRTGLAVLRHTKTASTLTEFGFISNKSEAASMKTNTDKYGKAMYDSVVKMFKTNPSKR